MENKEALNTLNDIKDMMERSSKFKAISGLSIVIVGILASLVSAYIYFFLGDYHVAHYYCCGTCPFGCGLLDGVPHGLFEGQASSASLHHGCNDASPAGQFLCADACWWVALHGLVAAATLWPHLVDNADILWLGTHQRQPFQLSRFALFGLCRVGLGPYRLLPGRLRPADLVPRFRGAAHRFRNRLYAEI